MAPGRSMPIHPSIAIGFFPLARPAPLLSSHLHARTASKKRTVVSLVLLFFSLIGAVFCLTVIGLIWRRKRQMRRRRRELELKSSMPGNGYAELGTEEAGSGGSGIYEMGGENTDDGRVNGQRVELPVTSITVPDQSAQPVGLQSHPP